MTTSAAENMGETYTLELSRTFPTTCEELYRCFTDPERVRQWFGPEGVTCESAELDVRVDGSYRITMKGAEDDHVVLGRFLALEPPHLIRMTWAWRSQPDVETFVTLRFEPAAGGATLHLTHERLASAEARDRHSEGWSSSFACLGEVLS